MKAGQTREDSPEAGRLLCREQSRGWPYLCIALSEHRGDCHKCSESSEVPLATPNSLQCGRKAPLDCRSEVWLRLELCPPRENGTSSPCLRMQSSQLCLLPPLSVTGAWNPRAMEGAVTGMVHSWRPAAALWSVCVVGGMFQPHVPLITEACLHPSLKIKAPGSSLQTGLQG